MPNWRRAHTPGATYFFTLVTDGRRPLFRTPFAVALLKDALVACQAQSPFDLEAMVVLPDHVHAMWTLPAGDAGYARRWSWIKGRFTQRWLSAGGGERVRSLGRDGDDRRGVWQPKYWEHEIRNDRDYENHFHYIHYNPVQHGHVTCVHDWRASTFHRHVRDGVYERRWGCSCGTRAFGIKLPPFPTGE